MGLETGNTIAALNANWPLGTDPRSQGDDHLRLIKAVMKNDALSKAAGGLVAGVTHFGNAFNSSLDQGAIRLGQGVGTLALQTPSTDSATGFAQTLFHGTTQTMFIRRSGDVGNLNNVYGGLSDARLKEDLAPATPKLADLLRLRVVNYRLKPDPTGAKQLGLVAQEVAEVFPTLVEEDENGFLSVKYSVLVPMLLKALQELTARVEALEA